MSWVEVDGAGWSWMELDGAGWKWVHSLVIPVIYQLCQVSLPASKIYKKQPIKRQMYSKSF